jgi:DNA repair protein RecN (Recombination protein N)
MLRELAVQNLALIEDVRVELEPGFCAWTGETGAGKSLLLGAVGLLLGERGSADLLRAGAEELRVSGVFGLTPELRRGVEGVLETALEDDDLIITRRLSHAGRSQAYVNDQPVTLATLRKLGTVLLDIHGQRESQSLLEPAYQLDLLDAFGHLEGPRRQYTHLAAQARKLRERHRTLTAAREQRQRDLALLRFERDELAKADLRAGELEELTAERQKLAHAQSLQAYTLGGYGRLYEEEGSVIEQVGKLSREGQAWAEFDPALAEAVARLDAVATEVRDIAEALQGLGEGYEADPARLEEVEQRLGLLRRLETKYGKPLDELVAYYATLEERETALRQQEDDLAGVQTELAAVYKDLRAAAEVLSKQRTKVAKKLAGEAQKHLADLGMADAKLSAVLETTALGDDPVESEVPALGPDHLELMLAANPGEAPRPLRKIASGGELSRTMLALKTVLAAHDRVGTLVFDEIDANVGGRLGDTIGQKLAALGQNRQVICVTHLPQVASYARHQWAIHKHRRGDRTVTTIERLAADERLEELASMIRGDARGETTRKEAAAMLAAAKKRW